MISEYRQCLHLQATSQVSNCLFSDEIWDIYLKNGCNTIPKMCMKKINICSLQLNIYIFILCTVHTANAHSTTKKETLQIEKTPAN